MLSLRAPVLNFDTGAPSRLPVPRQCSAAERWQRRVPRATGQRCSKSASWHGVTFALLVSCRRNCSGTVGHNAPAVPHTINACELAARRSVCGWRFAPQCYAWQAVRRPLRPRPTPRASVSAGTDPSNSAQVVLFPCNRRSSRAQLPASATELLQSSLHLPPRGMFCSIAHQRLTPRSRRGPTAGHQARDAVGHIICIAGLVACRRSRLNSNVRPRAIQTLPVQQRLSFAQEEPALRRGSYSRFATHGRWFAAFLISSRLLSALGVGVLQLSMPSSRVCTVMAALNRVRFCSHCMFWRLPQPLASQLVSQFVVRASRGSAAPGSQLFVYHSSSCAY